MLLSLKKLGLIPLVAGCVAVLASLAAPSIALAAYPNNHRHQHHSGHHHCGHHCGHHHCYPYPPGVVIPPVFRAPVTVPVYYPVSQPVYYPVTQPVATYSVYYRQTPSAEWALYGSYPTPLAAQTIGQNLIATGYQAWVR